MEEFRASIKRYFVLRRHGSLLAWVFLLLSIYLIMVASSSTYSEKYQSIQNSEISPSEILIGGVEIQGEMNESVLADRPLKNHYVRRKPGELNGVSQQHEDPPKGSTNTSFILENLPLLPVDPGSSHDDTRKRKIRNEETTGNRQRDEKDNFENVDFDFSREKSRPTEVKSRLINGSWVNYAPCNGLTVLQNGAFCLEENHVFINGNEVWDGKLCRTLEYMFGWSSILEVGAGLGHYGRCFYRINHNVIHVNDRKEREYLDGNYQNEMDAVELTNKTRIVKSWEGYDGAQNIGLLSGGFVQEMDLTQPFDLKQLYDWVLSLGAGEERLPRESRDTFLDSLAKHACKGIVLSWSADASENGSVASKLVSPLTSNDVIQRLNEKGFIHDRESQDVLRDSTRLSHLKDSVMVFRLPYEKQC